MRLTSAEQIPDGCLILVGDWLPARSALPQHRLSSAIPATPGRSDTNPWLPNVKREKHVSGAEFLSWSLLWACLARLPLCSLRGRRRLCNPGSARVFCTLQTISGCAEMNKQLCALACRFSREPQECPLKNKQNQTTSWCVCVIPGNNFKNVKYNISLARTENDAKVWSNQTWDMDLNGEIPLAFHANLFPPQDHPKSQQLWFQVAKGASVGTMDMLGRKKEMGRIHLQDWAH